MDENRHSLPEMGLDRQHRPGERDKRIQEKEVNLYGTGRKR